jgi:hypothetical protein
MGIVGSSICFLGISHPLFQNQFDSDKGNIPEMLVVKEQNVCQE